MKLLQQQKMASKNIQLLEWDTEFLGYPVGIFNSLSANTEDITSVLSSARTDGIKLLYWHILTQNKQAIAIAHTIDAYLADQKVTYCMPVKKVTEPLPSTIESAVELTPQLLSLTLQSGHQSRFQTDPKFSLDIYENLYRIWIENSISRKIAREVLVYRSEPNEAEDGFITLAIKDERVDIGLLAVDAEARGKNIGTKLINASHYYAASWNIQTLQVVTQKENKVACSFYEKCGFQIESLVNIYHIWL